MIGALTGIVAERLGDIIVIDVGGVGYQVSATDSVLEKIHKIGNRVKVLIFTDVKENSITLFGFDSLIEREVFLLLKKVSGVGSKTAMGIISSAGAEKVLNAIGNGETSALQRAPGVGKRIAERIIVELREHVRGLLTDISKPLSANIERSKISALEDVRLKSYPQMTQDAVLALEKLGFSADAAREAVLSAFNENGQLTDPGELLRLALSRC